MWISSHRQLQRAAALCLGLLISNAACSKKTPEITPPQPREEKPAASAQRRQPVKTRVAPAAAEPAPVDPALVPVEEDFRKDAEQRLTKKSDLRAELQRIERGMAAEKPAAEKPGAEKVAADQALPGKAAAAGKPLAEGQASAGKVTSASE